jgi:hypothetical protein
MAYDGTISEKGKTIQGEMSWVLVELDALQDMLLAIPASSEAPAEAFTADQIDTSARLLARWRDDATSVNDLTDEELTDAVNQLTCYARLVRERHTGKGQ